MSDPTWTREPLQHARSCAMSVAWIAMAFDDAYEFAHSDRPLSDLGECTCNFDRLADAEARGAEWIKVFGHLSTDPDEAGNLINEKMQELRDEADRWKKEANARMEEGFGSSAAATERASAEHYHGLWKKVCEDKELLSHRLCTLDNNIAGVEAENHLLNLEIERLRGAMVKPERFCPHCGCKRATNLGDLEEHDAGCPNFPL